MCSDIYVFILFFFFNDTAPTEIYTLSLHDALPICPAPPSHLTVLPPTCRSMAVSPRARRSDRKSTRLNSSHVEISYAVFCLKKKNKASTKGGKPVPLPVPVWLTSLLYISLED